MTTYHTTGALLRPAGDNLIPPSTFTYLRTRNRMKAFNVLRHEFDKSGLTVTQLAKRMGKGADRVCHVLNAPANLTLDTFSEFLFGMTGAEPTYGTAYPLDRPARNHTRPDWLSAPEIQAKPSTSGEKTLSPKLSFKVAASVG